MLTAALNVRLTDIWKSTRGRGGGSFAHWQMALAYVKYLTFVTGRPVVQNLSRLSSNDNYADGA